MRTNLTKRDFEILRTLVRVQFATTRDMRSVFFRNIGLARKRMAILRTAELITDHSKGLPGQYSGCNSQVWRITESGITALLREFPKERIPENLISRTRRSSLRNFEHRDNMTGIYLRLIRVEDQDIDTICARANTVDWHGEYDLTLPYQEVVGVRYERRKVIPDATLTTARARYFVEVDMSTEAGARIRRTLKAYARASHVATNQEVFSPGVPACLLYVTKSESRAKSLRKVIAEAGPLPFEAKSMSFDTACEWLRTCVDGAPASDPTIDTGEEFRTCRSHLLRVYNEVMRLIDDGGRFDLTKGMPAVFTDAYHYLEATTYPAK